MAIRQPQKITVFREGLDDLIVNELVHALTNRQGPFPDGNIPLNKDFRPREQSMLWTSLRAGLFLDNESTDYYILLAISILQAHPDVFEMIPNKFVSFDTYELGKYRNKIMYGAFFTAGNRVGAVLSYPDYFPVAYEYIIKYNTASNLKVTTDLGREFFCDCKSFEKEPGTALQVDWSKRLPFKGPIKSDLPWKEGSYIVVNYIPSTIDYKKWSEYLEAKLIVENVLTPLGLYTSYQLSRSYTEKIALLIAALALQNTSITNSHGQE